MDNEVTIPPPSRRLGRARIAASFVFMCFADREYISPFDGAVAFFDC